MLVYIMHFLSHFQGLDTWELFGTSLYITSAFLDKERPGFAALFGILVALSFDGVSSLCIYKFTDIYVYHFPWLSLLKLNK